MSGAVQSVVTVAGRAGVAVLALALVLHGSTKCPSVHKVAASAPASARELTDDDFARGFVVCRVGMGEAHDFSPPPNAVAVADWRAFGAAEDWVYLDLASRGWSYRVGANRATRLRVHSSGRVEPLVSGGGAALVPVCATLGIVPEANWGLLPESDRPSGVRYALTPSNTLQLTWRNALVGRRADAPATFQCELWPDGRADFRYDLSRIPVGTADGLRASVSLGGESWSAAVPRDGALSLCPIDPVDRDSPDRDGLPAVDEVLAYGTDPGCDDTDLDGLRNPDELAAGTDPRTPNTDGDGLSDGEEVALGTDPLAADGDGDGLSDFDEVCVHGTDPLRVDTDGDGLPDAEESARGTSHLAADTDGDGLDDAREFLVGTDPLVADTDGDGAPDGWELENGSDPRRADTDGDGVDDGEVAGCFRVRYGEAESWASDATVAVAGMGASTVDSVVTLLGKPDKTSYLGIAFDVGETGDDADLIQNGNITQHKDYPNGGLVKKGAGTLLLNGKITYTTAPTKLVEGELRLGASGVMTAAQNLEVSGGTVSLTDGTVNAMGDVTFAADSKIAFGKGAKLDFRSLTLAEGVKLAVVSDDRFGGFSVVRRLTGEELARLMVNGCRAFQSATGKIREKRGSVIYLR